MARSDHFGDTAVISEMAAEHVYLWRALFRACEPHLKPGARILDFGCGDGSMLAYLILGDGRKWPGLRPGLCVGIDLPALDPVLAAAAVRLGHDPRLPVVFSSAVPSAFPCQFDLVISHEVIYLLPNLERSFRQLCSALTGGGVIAMATGCHEENPLYPRWRKEFARFGVRARRYTIDDFTQALLSAGFDDIEARPLRLSSEDYDEWVSARGGSDPNPSWFRSAEEERRYYTETGKTLLLGRKRVPRPDARSTAPITDRQ